MKNIRNFALVAVMVSSVAAVNAQSFELRAGAGTTLVGNTFNVGAIGSSFDIEIWYNGSSNLSVVSGAAWLGIGRASSVSATTNLDSSLSLGGASAAASVEFTPFLGMSTIGAAAAAGGANAVAGTNNPYAGSERPFVVGQAFASSPGSPAVALGAAPFKMFTIHLKNSGLGQGASYDNLLVYNQGTAATAPTTRGSGWGTGGTAGVREGSASYRVQAVPEPATLAILGLGLAAAARRRRAK